MVRLSTSFEQLTPTRALELLTRRYKCVLGGQVAVFWYSCVKISRIHSFTAAARAIGFLFDLYVAQIRAATVKTDVEQNKLKGGLGDTT